MKLTRRMSSFAPSATMAISARVTELRSRGKDVIGFSAGEPDFDVPEHAKDAAIRAIREGKNKYTPVGGHAELKNAVLKHMKNEYGLEYGQKEIIVSCGGKHSLYNISQVLFEEGDEVIIFTPYWVTYPDQVRLAGATPVIIQCDGAEGFNPAPDKVRAAVTEKTKAVILNSPGNPSGAVYPEQIVRAIADIAVENDLILISDEIYSEIVYDGATAFAPATIGEDVKNRTLVVNGFSKTFSMTGWRLGFTLGPEPIISAMTKIQSQSTSNPPTPLQFGAAAAIGDLSFVEARVKTFRKRRDIMVEALNSLDGVKCATPAGAFYAFPDFSGWIGKKFEGTEITDSVTLTELLIEKALIAPVPGIAFGMENYLRFSYALDTERVKEGLERLAAFAKELI